MRLTSLPLQLLAFVILPLLVLLVVVAFGGVALHQDEMRDMLVAHNRQVVAGAAKNLSEQLAQRQQLLSKLADTAAEPEALLRESAWLAPLFPGGIAIFQENAVTASPSQAAAWADLADQVTRAGGSGFLPLAEPEGGVTRVAVIGLSAGDPARRVVGIVPLDALASHGILESLHASRSTELYLLGPDGAVLYDSAPGRPDTRIWTAAESVQTDGAVQALEAQDARGRDAIVTVAPVPAPGWLLVHEERWKETLSPLMRYSQAAPLALVPAVLIAVGAMWFGIQRIVYPLRRLEAQATDLSWGAYDAVRGDVGGIEEIRRLQETLRHMAARVQAAQASMHNYIGAITHAQEDERRRLARELHDQTAQALVALDHRQQMLKPYLKDDPAAAALLAEVRSMIAETIDDLRRIVRALRPIYLEELGLAPALQMLARDLGLDDKLTIHFEKQGIPQRLAPEDEMALYRVAQEALNNAWQHSGATQVWLTVQFAEDQVRITVRDNGKGFRAPSHAAELGQGPQEHFGLMGMYERAALIGAHLQVQSEPGEGATVTVRAPVTPRSDPASDSQPSDHSA